MLPKTPAKGMRDFLPAEFSLRQKILSTIQQTYESFGFTRIETPAVENIQLLTSKQGGDNEKLIFKILKRGEKLENATEDSLCDLGLRYDLTVPLARFYSNNVGKLPTVFKAMQMDNVWRADRPQKGRFRQFVQCDIDIIGEETNLAEIELISATMQALSNLGFDNVTIRLSDRRLLNALAEKCGFTDEQKPDVFIALDKLDKVGLEGVLAEVNEIAPDKAKGFVDLIEKITGASCPFDTCVSELGDYLPKEVADNVSDIIRISNNTIKNGKVVFDVTLVRGMGYYTGTIYEISIDGLNISVGGGGRYDKMIGKIAGTDAPACGFSIGFERICLLLEERAGSVSQNSGIAVVVEKNLTADELIDISKKCAELRKECKVSVYKRIKNFGFQIKQLQEQGYNKILQYKNGELVALD